MSCPVSVHTHPACKIWVNAMTPPVPMHSTREDAVHVYLPAYRVGMKGTSSAQVVTLLTRSALRQLWHCHY